MASHGRFAGRLAVFGLGLFLGWWLLSTSAGADESTDLEVTELVPDVLDAGPLVEDVVSTVTEQVTAPVAPVVDDVVAVSEPLPVVGPDVARVVGETGALAQSPPVPALPSLPLPPLPGLPPVPVPPEPAPGEPGLPTFAVSTPSSATTPSPVETVSAVAATADADAPVVRAPAEATTVVDTVSSKTKTVISASTGTGAAVAQLPVLAADGTPARPPAAVPVPVPAAAASPAASGWELPDRGILLWAVLAGLAGAAAALRARAPVTLAMALGTGGARPAFTPD